MYTLISINKGDLKFLEKLYMTQKTVSDLIFEKFGLKTLAPGYAPSLLHTVRGSALFCTRKLRTPDFFPMEKKSGSAVVNLLTPARGFSA